MIANILVLQFEKDLLRLKNELIAYKNESNLWVLEGDILNTSGNLAMHLVGNLNHFIGHVLGKTDYIRNRPFEFEGKNIPREKMLTQIDETIDVVKQTLESLSTEQLEHEYPIHVFKNEAPMSTAHMLIHLSNHLNYHLGQINYHRRMLDK